MLIDETVIVKWDQFTKKHYVDLGYCFTKIGDEFEVKVDDLPIKSHKKVKVKCDSCGKITEKEYRQYLISKQYEDGFGDLCSECSGKRFCLVLQNKYGGIGLASPTLKKKIQQTNIEKYGVHAPMMNQEVYKKVRKTQDRKYGGIGFGSSVTKNKINKVIKEQYNVDNISQSEEIKLKKENTCLEHYGVKHILQIPDVVNNVVSKAKETMTKNGTVPSSKFEKEICKQIVRIYGFDNCIPQYNVGPLIFDCLLIVNGVKIDVEYDGWYWHKNRIKSDRKRNYKVISLGYKVLRIKSNYKLPTDEQIIDAVNYLTLENHHYKEIVLDI